MLLGSFIKSENATRCVGISTRLGFSLPHIAVGIAHRLSSDRSLPGVVTVVAKSLLLVACLALCLSSPASRADASNDRNYRLGDRVFLKIVDTAYPCNGKPYAAGQSRQCRWDLLFENDNEYSVHVTLRIRTHYGRGQLHEGTLEYWLKPGYLYCGDEIRARGVIELNPLAVEPGSPARRVRSAAPRVVGVCRAHDRRASAIRAPHSAAVPSR